MNLRLPLSPSAIPRLPTPQELVEYLLRVLPPPTRSQPTKPATEDAIVEAALAAFARQGIRATTMSQIAKDAGISREWLYKHFRNRDAVVAAVIRREVLRFIDGLAVGAFRSDSLPEALTEAFVYSVEFLRDHPVLHQVLDSDAESLSPRLLRSAEPVLGVAIEAGAGYLGALGDLAAAEAVLVTETLVRLVATIAFAPRGSLDLHDADELRRYATTVVPALLSGVSASPAGPRRTTALAT